MSRGTTTAGREKRGMDRLQEQLQAILGQMKEAYLVINRAGVLIQANSFAEAEILDRPAGEIIGQSVFDALPDGSQPAFAEPFRSFLLDGQPASFVYQSKASQKWYRVDCYPRDDDCDVYFRPLPMHGREDEGVSASRMPEENPNPVLRADQQGRVLFCNSACERILGPKKFRRNEILPEPACSIAAKSLNSGKKHSFEFEMETNGRVFAFSVSPFPEKGYVNFYGSDITTLKNGEEERDRLLEENQRQKDLLEQQNWILESQVRELNALFDTLPVAVMIYDQHGRTIERNQLVLDYYGVDPLVADRSELMEILKITHADGSPIESIKNMPAGQALHGSQVRNERYRFTRTDGEEKYVMASANPIRDGSGQIVGAVATWNDITELEKAEAAQRVLEEENRRQKELLQAIFNAMTEAVTIFDQDGHLTRMNAPALHYYGAEEIGQNRLDNIRGALKIFSPEGMPLSRAEMPVTRALQGETVRNFQLQFINSQDQTFDVITSAAPLYQQGEQAGAVVVWRDITDRESLNRQLQSERTLLKAVLEQMPAGVLVTEVPSERVIMSNQRVNEIFKQNYPIGELIELGPFTGFHPDGREYKAEEWPLARSIRSGEVVHNEEIRILRGDDTMGTVSVNSAPVFDDQGKIIAGVVIFFDISDRIQSEKNSQFLQQFGEHLLLLDTPTEIHRYATHALGEYLGTSHSLVEEVALRGGTTAIVEDYSPGLPSLVGRYKFTRFHHQVMKMLQEDQLLVITDVRLDPRTARYAETAFIPTGMQSIVAIPLFRRDVWVATLTVTDNRPRVWREDEIGLLHSAANMLWMSLESAHLLQDLEQSTRRFNVALKNAPVSVYTLDKDLRFTWVYKPPFNLRSMRMLGKRDDDLLLPEEAARLVAIKRKVLATGRGTRREVNLTIEGQPRIYDITLEPMRTGSGEVTGLTVAWIDITGQRRLQNEMVLHNARIEIQRVILRYRELERQEIARDLHDGVLQEMIGINFLMNDITEGNEDDQEALIKTAHRIRESLQGQIRELRAFCSELRPPTLAPFGLEKAISSHLDGFMEKHPEILVHDQLEKDRKLLPEETRLALFRVYQEAMNNILRHSEATEIWITFELKPGEAHLEIWDNGKGFPIPREWVTLARAGHLGLVGMNERVQALNGQLEIDSSPDHGTRIWVVIPI